jgi:hypothetical protein
MSLDYRLPTEVTLYVVCGILGTGIIASLAFERWRSKDLPLTPRPAPISDLTDAAVVAQRNFRKVVILIAGTVVILVGLAIAPLPGPGPLVLVPMGLVILATEFVWAKRILDNLKDITQQLAQTGDRVGARIPRWSLLPITIAYYSLWLAAYSLALRFTDWRFLQMFCLFTCWGLSLPFLTWVFRTARRTRPGSPLLVNQDSSGPPVDPPAHPANDRAR